jgi:transketolase
MLGMSIRRLVIEHSYRAGVGHIGSALSVADILGALFGHVLRGQPDDPARDRFVMSKGHAALALFAALALAGRIERSELDSFCQNGGRLGVHPEATLPGVDFGTGSLGQGLSVGAGAALASKLQRRDGRTYVLLSDAELNEGAVWEAAQFAAHHQLSSLIAIIDLNGQQAFGYTRDVLDLPDPGRSFASFGWDVVHADGHEERTLAKILDEAPLGERPLVVVAKTVFGSGVSFMEREIPWHYLPLDDEHYRVALSELVRP